ncbi:MAG: hypothetical protein GXX85_18195 [Ignavibacteria bacterium]|nr:hypothetical protein [Ignavibacteria bacterium]
MKQKRPRGRPIGGKSDPTLRAYWRYTKSNYRSKMSKEAKKDINQARRRKP